MEDEIKALREEVAALRREVAALKPQHLPYGVSSHGPSLSELLRQSVNVPVGVPTTFNR